MDALLERYVAGMARYVATGAEAPLLDIEELGRRAITDDISLDEIAGLHEGAALALSDRGVPINQPAIIRRMSACLSALMVSAAVAYRTKIDLLEQQRRQERDRTERDRQRLETLGQFVGSVAHELNNLLQPVRGMTEIMLADLAETPPERADLEVVEACTIQVVTVIQGILNYVRRETIAPQSLAFGDAVASACSFIRPMLREPFEVAIRDRQTEVLAIQGELTQILLNLIRNAVQAGAHRILIAVDRIRRDEPGAVREAAGAKPWMRLRVIDDGHGMNSAVAAQALDPYFTTKPIGEGTGLGLAIVRSIVVGWSGDLEIHSEPERGTTVTLRLPVSAG